MASIVGSTLELKFLEQVDGRRMARLPNGKIVLVDEAEAQRVANGESWRVAVKKDMSTYVIVEPLTRIAEAERPPLDAWAKDVEQVMEKAKVTPVATPRHVPMVQVRQNEKVEVPVQKVQQVKVGHVGGMLVEPDDIVHPGDRVAVFVDGANMDGASRDAGYRIDFKRALDYFLGNGSLYAAFYYTADFAQHESKYVKFTDYLSYSNYIIRKKPLKEITDESGNTVYKSNVDIELVIDLINTSENYDVAYIFSGDSDFERAVELLRSKGKRVYVVTSRNTVSRELAYVADKPVFHIEDFREQICRADQG